MNEIVGNFSTLGSQIEEMIRSRLKYDLAGENPFKILAKINSNIIIFLDKSVVYNKI